MPESVSASIFLTRENPPRLRLLWRLIGFVVFVLFFVLLLAIPYAVLAGINSLQYNPAADVLLSAAALTLAVLAARRLLDRRSIASLGLDWRRGQPGRDLWLGVAIAAGMMALIFGLHLAAGWARLVGPGWSTGDPEAVLRQAALWGLLFILVGFYEELLTRGYILQNLEDGLNTGWAVFLSSGVFGLLHLSNPNSSPVAVLGILGAGLLFAFAYLRTRALWLPIGLHVGWNFFEGVVFGFPVSGLETARLLEIEVTGPALWTGGAFGPEAGLVLLPGLLGAALWAGYATRHRRPQPALQGNTTEAG